MYGLFFDKKLLNHLDVMIYLRSNEYTLIYIVKTENVVLIRQLCRVDNRKRHVPRLLLWGMSVWLNIPWFLCLHVVNNCPFWLPHTHTWLLVIPIACVSYSSHFTCLEWLNSLNSKSHTKNECRVENNILLI